MLHWCEVDGSDDAIKPLNRACQEVAHPVEPKAPASDAPWPTSWQAQEQPMQVNPQYSRSTAPRPSAGNANGYAQLPMLGALQGIGRPITLLSATQRSTAALLATDGHGHNRLV
jgi:hypothetical protein